MEESKIQIEDTNSLALTTAAMYLNWVKKLLSRRVEVKDD